MEVRLRLLWGLGKYFPDLPVGGTKLVLPEGTSLGELLENYHIPGDAVGLIAVNGSLVKRDRILKDQDDVQLYPPLEGG